MKKVPGFRNGIVLILAVSLQHFEATADDPVTVDAGPDQTSTLPINSTMIAAIVSGGEHESSTWGVAGGDASNVTIESPEKLTSPVSFSSAGIYTLEISVVAGTTVTDSLEVTILEPGPIFRPDIRIGNSVPTESHSRNDIYNEEGRGQHLVIKPHDKQPVRFFLSIENDGNVPDQISLRGAGISRTRLRVVYLDTTEEETRNITKEVLEDRYLIPNQNNLWTIDVLRVGRTCLRFFRWMRAYDLRMLRSASVR